MKVIQNSNFSCKSQILLFFFLEVIGSLCSFSREYMPNTQLRIIIVILSNENGVNWKMKLVQLTTQIIAQYFEMAIVYQRPA